MLKKEMFAIRVMSQSNFYKETKDLILAVVREFGKPIVSESLNDFVETLEPIDGGHQVTAGDFVVYSNRSGKLLDINVILDSDLCFGIPLDEEEGEVLRINRGRTIEGFYRSIV